MKQPVLHTHRLLMRRWEDRDRPVLAVATSDVEVARYRRSPMTRQESDGFIDDVERCFDDHGFGLWALERIEDGRLLGYAGLAISDFDAPFCPAVDVGWTLAPDTWGQGYATEAAVASLGFGFDEVQLGEVVAHTTEANERSQAVMRRLGMAHDPDDDFDGPWYPVGHPRRRFVLYRMTADGWRRRRGAGTGSGP